MSHAITFRQVAILPPQLWEGSHVDLQKWIRQALHRGADVFYMRVPPTWTGVPKAWHAELEEIHGQCIFPAQLSLNYPTAQTVHFKASDPASPVPGKACGRSCHSLADIHLAIEAGFDYVFLSPVFSTNTHGDATPIGLEALAAACAASSIPIFALGGINLSNKASCIAQGAFGIAAIGMFSQ